MKKGILKRKATNMLRTILCGSIVLLAVGATLQSHAALTLGSWDFTGQSGSGPYSPTAGTQSGSATLTASGTFALNSTGTLTTGQTYPYLDFSTTSGGSFILHLSGTGLSGFVVSYLGEKNGGSGTVTWSYSTTGTGGSFSSTGLTQPGALGSAFASSSIDFSPITALNNQANVYLQVSFGAKTAFDNIQVSAVPEPIHYGLAAFGLIFVGVGTGRRFWLARKIA
jgi:hypothetical protein